MTKQELRNEIRRAIDALSAAYREEASSVICSKILSSDEYRTCRTILLYVPLPDEVDITPVIEQAIRDRKEVALPVIDGSQMIFRRVDTLWKGKLKEGALQVAEPDASYEALELSGRSGILIVTPGRAFSAQGMRLGRGKGYYDRFFSSVGSEGVRMAAAFDLQITDRVPAGAHDLPVHIIFSESRTFRD